MSVIATQGETNIRYGIHGLRLLKEGFSPKGAFCKMLLADQRRESRQVIIIDVQGRTAAFTGRKTVEWKGHFVRENHVATGNMLAESDVIEAMTKAFKLRKEI